MEHSDPYNEPEIPVVDDQIKYLHDSLKLQIQIHTLPLSFLAQHSYIHTIANASPVNCKSSQTM
jgi:hypothetical protein